MSIAAFRENLPQQTSFFCANALPSFRAARHRPLHKLGSLELPSRPHDNAGKSPQKQERPRLHNSHGKITQGALQKLRNQAATIRKKIALNATSDAKALLQPKREGKTKGEGCLEQHGQEASSKADSPLKTHTLDPHLSTASSAATLSSLKNSTLLSEPTCADSSIGQQRQLKALQVGGRSEVFEVVQFLDAGSFGEVHLVRHLTTGMLLCLKSMRKDQFCAESLSQLAREIRIQSALSHPNIIKLYGCTHDERHVYLLMEPCLGSNLFRLMAGSALPEADARGYLLQVSQAVGYLHGLDVIHRDIKPENVLVDGTGTAKLCDFGWAVHAPLLRETRCGTPLYTPPEMVRQESYDAKVDVWCLGLMAYELLYGALPFDIRSLEEVSRIATDPVAFPPSPNVSPQAEDFIRGCLAKQACSRFSIQQALAHEFLQKRKLQFRHTFP